MFGKVPIPGVKRVASPVITLRFKTTGIAQEGDARMTAKAAAERTELFRCHKAPGIVRPEKVRVNGHTQLIEHGDMAAALIDFHFAICHGNVALLVGHCTGRPAVHHHASRQCCNLAVEHAPI